MEKEIINRVSNSGLVSLDLEELYPETEIAPFDVSNLLWQGLVLREKEFREALKNTDWSIFKGKTVAIFCSADAIVPTWAYMLISIYLSQHGILHEFGKPDDVFKVKFIERIKEIDYQKYENAKVVVKGCSKKEVPLEVFVKVTENLFQHASSIMFGEPCSTVPLWKKQKYNA
ncbi:MAG: DUF2480 family protein [Cytophagales bacterium]